MSEVPFQMRVPAHYLPAYVDIRRLKKKLECLVQRAQHQRATVQRRLDILQRPRMLPHTSTYPRQQRQTPGAVAGDQHEGGGSPLGAPAAGGLTGAQPAASPSAAAAARADDGMAGSSLRAEAETLSLLPESQFWALLQQQAHELNKFATAKERQIQSDMRAIAARMEEASPSLSVIKQSQQLWGETRSCSSRNSRLAKTTRWFSTSLLKEAYCNVDLERLVLMLSLLWGKFRSKQEGRQLGSEAWKPPETFVRTTTKYWIRPENIVRAQCLIVRHLPFLVFGTSDKDLEASLLGAKACKEGRQLPSSNLAPTQMVASVYFDSADAYSYERRIRRFEGAQLLRFRWYGTNNNGPDEEIFIERKTHHESWSGQSSTKERFVIPQRLVAPYMLLQRSAKELLLEASGFQPPVPACKSAVSSPTGVSSAEQPETQEAQAAANDAVEEAAAAFIAKNKKLKKAIALGEEIQDEIAEHQLQPMLRTSYLRAAFQLATSNEVRISLDTNLCMVKEYRPQRHDEASTNWCRLADELLGKDEVVRFPYAILEVKVQQQPPPDWVESMLVLMLLQCPLLPHLLLLLVAAAAAAPAAAAAAAATAATAATAAAARLASLVYKFSKFQHGMAFLHREKISSGLLPHWLQPQTSPPQQQEEQQHPSRRRPLAAGAPHLGVSLFDSIRSSADNLLTPLARSFADQTHQGLAPGGPGKKRSLLSPADGAGLVSADGDWEDISQTAAHRTFLWLKMEQELQLQQAPRPLCLNGDSEEEGKAEGGKMHESHASSADSLRQRLVRRHIRTVRKIDPKTSFAGERTFLHYIQKGLYLAGASIACLETLSGGWGLVVALVLAVACVLLCCGAYAIYVNRCRRISQRVAKAGAANVRQAIDSQWGPLLAFGAAGLATALVLILQVDINLKHVLKNEREAHMVIPEEHRRHLNPQVSSHLNDL
ncbi:hypothetical protein Emed_005074 [Eimeria media]